VVSVEDPVIPAAAPLRSQVVRSPNPERSSSRREECQIPALVTKAPPRCRAADLRTIGPFWPPLWRGIKVEAPAKPELAFRSATPRDCEVMIGRKGTIFGGLLRARGVGRQKSPGLGDILEAEEGKTGDVSAALQARPRWWFRGRPGLSYKPESGGARSPNAGGRTSTPASIAASTAPASATSRNISLSSRSAFTEPADNMGARGAGRAVALGGPVEFDEQ
jgi:hypothetical protein